jgi:hypothetical protein
MGLNEVEVTERKRAELKRAELKRAELTVETTDFVTEQRSSQRKTDLCSAGVSVRRWARATRARG